jgi:hypothetical protein
MITYSRIIGREVEAEVKVGSTVGECTLQIWRWGKRAIPLSLEDPLVLVVKVEMIGIK